MKKIKNLLLVLCLIPCLLFAACSGGNSDITMKEYEDLMTKSALNYYQNSYGKSMTITTQRDFENKYNDTIYYGEDDENETKVEFSYKGKTTQKIEIYSYNADKAPNVKITTKSEYTSAGYEENEDETGVMPYSESGEEEEIITFVYSYDDVEEEDKVTAYIYNKILAGDELSERSEFYEYYSAESGYNDIWNLIENIEDEVMGYSFFSSEYRSAKLMYGEEPTYFDEDGLFGFDLAFESNEVYGQRVTTTNATAKMTFANNLPSKYEINYTTSQVDKDTPAGQTCASGKGTVSCEVNYSSSSIYAPIGFEDERYYFNYSYVDILSPEVMEGP